MFVFEPDQLICGTVSSVKDGAPLWVAFAGLYQTASLMARLKRLRHICFWLAANAMQTGEPSHNSRFANELPARHAMIGWE